MLEVILLFWFLQDPYFEMENERKWKGNKIKGKDKENIAANKWAVKNIGKNYKWAVKKDK